MNITKWLVEQKHLHDAELAAERTARLVSKPAHVVEITHIDRDMREIKPWGEQVYSGEPIPGSMRKFLAPLAGKSIIDDDLDDKRLIDATYRPLDIDDEDLIIIRPIHYTTGPDHPPKRWVHREPIELPFFAHHRSSMQFYGPFGILQIHSILFYHRVVNAAYCKWDSDCGMHLYPFSIL